MHNKHSNVPLFCLVDVVPLFRSTPVTFADYEGVENELESIIKSSDDPLRRFHDFTRLSVMKQQLKRSLDI